MPKSRALKEEMQTVKQTTPQDMMNEGREQMVSAKNSMMRGQAIMAGSQMMMKKKKKAKGDMMEYSDLGGMNFDPKKMKRGK